MDTLDGIRLYLQSNDATIRPGLEQLCLHSARGNVKVFDDDVGNLSGNDWLIG